MSRTLNKGGNKLCQSKKDEEQSRPIESEVILMEILLEAKINYWLPQ